MRTRRPDGQRLVEAAPPGLQATLVAFLEASVRPGATTTAVVGREQQGVACHQSCWFRVIPQEVSEKNTPSSWGIPSCSSLAPLLLSNSLVHGPIRVA